MNNKELNNNIKDLKERLIVLTNDINKLIPIDANKKLKEKIDHELYDINYILNIKMKKIENEINNEIKKQNDIKYRETIAKINSPSKIMIKNAENVLGVKKGLIK
jgi:hypothetical protein